MTATQDSEINRERTIEIWAYGFFVVFLTLKAKTPSDKLILKCILLHSSVLISLIIQYCVISSKFLLTLINQCMALNLSFPYSRALFFFILFLQKILLFAATIIQCPEHIVTKDVANLLLSGSASAGLVCSGSSGEVSLSYLSLL